MYLLYQSIVDIQSLYHSFENFASKILVLDFLLNMLAVDGTLPVEVCNESEQTLQQGLFSFPEGTI